MFFDAHYLRPTTISARNILSPLNSNRQQFCYTTMNLNTAVEGASRMRPEKAAILFAIRKGRHMSGSKGTKRLLGRILLDGGLVSPTDLELALAEQQNSGEMLGEVLVRLGILDTAQIKAALATQEYLGSIDCALKTAAGPRDRLGLLLCKAGYISEDTLDDALTLQKATGEKLGEILIRIGVITAEQLDALLQFQKNQENAPMEGGPLKLGELLVTTGAITREQLTETIGSRRQSTRKLGEILIEKGYITSGQIEHSLNLQQKLVAASLLAVLSLGLSACGGGGEVAGVSETA